MSTAETYYIGNKSITSGGKTHSRDKVVTAKAMGLDDKTFKAFVGKGHIKTGTPPEDPKVKAIREAEAAAIAARQAATEGNSILRADRICKLIPELYRPDGSRNSEDDFTNAGAPTVDALNAIFTVIGDESEISATERDEAWVRYEAEKAEAAKAAEITD